MKVRNINTKFIITYCVRLGTKKTRSYSVTVIVHCFSAILIKKKARREVKM